MPKLIIALFNKSPYALEPWAKRGYICKSFDLSANCGYRGGQFYEAMDLSNIQDIIDYIEEGGIKPSLIISFPPCNDLAVSGAKHFKNKKKKDPQFQAKAMKLFLLGIKLAKYFGCPSITENPVSRAATLYRKPDIIIHPNEYGGYINSPGIHPEWPEYIVPRDRYRKKTCYWITGGFKMPKKKVLSLYNTGVKTKLGKQGNSKQFLKLGGKSEKTKTIRSLTPRGVFIGVYHSMKGELR